MKTTNYYNTFIGVADDCPVRMAEVPPLKGDKTVARIQFEMVVDNPYKYTSDDVIFQVFAEKNKLAREELATEREKFFSKGQPCFRSSPLAKRYGWGVHSNEEGRIAIYAVDSDKYRSFLVDKRQKVLKAMRSKRADK